MPEQTTPDPRHRTRRDAEALPAATLADLARLRAEAPDVHAVIVALIAAVAREVLP